MRSVALVRWLLTQIRHVSVISEVHAGLREVHSRQLFLAEAKRRIMMSSCVAYEH